MIFACIAVLLAVFTFADLPIAHAVYRPNTLFGEAFEIAAPGAAPLVLLFFAACLFWEQHRKGNRVKAAGLLAFMAASAGLAAQQMTHYAQEASLLVTGVLAALFFTLFLALCARLCPDSERLLRAFIAALIMVAAVFVTVEVVKILWGRMRFRAMDNPQTQFTIWLLPQGRPLSDAQKSFPSGHTANGAAVLLLLLIPWVFPGARRYQKVLGAGVFTWILLTALSRMVEGAHFASDVTMGFFIAFAAFCAVTSRRVLKME